MSENVACPSVEHQFHRVIHAIEQRLQLLDRIPRVRINAWIKKLRDEVSGNATWQRNRNCYARLLLEQLRAGCLEVPFNTMPPEGSLPTLPSYLMYRFFSPPKQQRSTYSSLGYINTEYSPDSTLAGCATAGLARPHSAGAAAMDGSHALKQLPAAGVHDSWRVVWGSAVSPRRCGSPPSARNVALQQQQQQWHSGSPKSVRSTGSGQRGYGSSKGSPQRPRSPGAAGLLDAAAVVAAEMEAEREEASRMSSRLRFAEDKLLQQEAELVRLQGAASSARRRIKSATSATLQELLERYGAAAAAWTGAAGGGSPTSASGALADGVYKPVWQLLAGLQSVLDSCDQEEHEWVRAKGSAAAAALEAAYEAQEAAAAAGGGMYPWDGAASTGTKAADSLTEGSPKKASQQQQSKGVGQFASEAAAAAAAEAAVLKHCEQCLLELQHQAEQLVAGLAVKKDEATAAAGGRGAAADVAEAAAKLLKPMLKALRHEAKDANKLRKRLEVAAEATDAAAASASGIAGAAAKSASKLQKSLLCHEDGNSSSSSSSGSDSSTSDSESAASIVSSRSRSSRKGKRRQLRHEQKVLASAEQQQQQQGARLQRLQSASQVLMELDKASAKLELQMKEAQQRLQDMAVAGAATGASNHHDNGLVAAGTAGLAASLSAGLRAFHSTSGNLCHLIQSLRSAAAEAAVAASRASEGGRSTGGGSQQQQQRRSSLLRSPSSTPRGEQNVHFSLHDSSGGGKAPGGASSSPGKLLGRSASSRLGDAALAGTWGEQEAAAAAALTGSAAGPLLSRSGSEHAASGGGSAYDATAHYLIGAAAAATAARTSAAGSNSRATSGMSLLSPRGLTLSVNPEAAAATAEGWRVLRSTPTSPRTLCLGNKAAFAEQLQGSAGGSSLSGGSSPRGTDAAAEAVHAVHTQLAGLSRQASRLSLKANAILAAGGADAAAAAAGGLSSSGGMRTLSGASSLSGSLRQREAPSAGISPFTAASLSPRGGALGAGLPAAGVGLGGLGISSAFGSNATSPPAANSLLSSATRSALLGQGGRGIGLGATGLGIGARPSLVGSYSSSLLKGGAVGGLSSSSSASYGLGAGSLLRSAGAGVGKYGVQSAPGIPTGTGSSLAAISSRLHSLSNGGR